MLVKSVLGHVSHLAGVYPEFCSINKQLESNLSTTATLGTEEGGYRRELAIMGR